MSDIPIWQCEFFELKTIGPTNGGNTTLDGDAPLNALTVGAKFGWKCHGDLAVPWASQTPVSLVFPKPEDQYSLVILKAIRQDANDVQFVVTSYKAGAFAPEYVRVVQLPGSSSVSGAQDSSQPQIGFETSHPRWQVRSVLDPKQQQPPQPYGPFGPWALSLPWWFTAALLVFLILVLALVVRWVRRASQRRKMLETLRRHKIAIPPLHQYYRDSRQIRRRIDLAKDASDLKAISSDLDRDFRLYVLREFQIPTLEWSDRAILEDLRRRHRPIYRESSEKLRKTLRELTKLKDRAQTNATDLEQVHRMSLETAELMESPAAKSREGKL